MNKLWLLAVLLVAACSSEPTPRPQMQPQQHYQYRQANTCGECENCCTRSYTVRKPVEVLYKDTTYTTVYEPKTYESVNYVRKPYNGCETDLCN